MNSNNNNSFLSGEHISGISVLQDALELRNNLNLKNYKIINLFPGYNDTDAVNVGQLDQAIANIQIPPLNQIQNDNNLSGNLNLNTNSYNVFVNNADISQSSQQVVNVNNLLTAKNDAIQQSKDYTDLRETSIKEWIDDLDYVTHPELQQATIASAGDAMTAGRMYTDTSLYNYARLDNAPTEIKTTGGNLSFNAKTAQTQGELVTQQYHLFGLPDVDMNSTAYREKSQPLSAAQLQREFCSTAQKETLIQDYKDRDQTILQTAKSYTDAQISPIASKSLVSINTSNPMLSSDFLDLTIPETLVKYKSIWSDALKTQFSNFRTSAVNIQCLQDVYGELLLGYLGGDETLQNQINTLTGSVSSDYALKSYVNTQDTNLSNRITTLESAKNKICTTNEKAKIICTNDNQIDFYANGYRTGYIASPTNYPNEFMLISPDRIALQSQASSILLYGGLQPSITNLINTHGVYLTGADLSGALVQSLLQLGVGNSQLNLSSGHLANGTLFSTITSNNCISLCGGLIPKSGGGTENEIILYNLATKSALSKMGSIEFSDFAVYSSNFTPINSLQLVHKGYVDTTFYTQTAADARYYLNTTKLNAITIPNGNVNVNNWKITNLATPIFTTDAVNKTYVDSNFYSQTTSDGRYYLNTTTLNNITLASSSLSLNSQKITNLALPTLANDAVNKTYVDQNFYTQTQSDAKYYLKTTTLDGIALPTFPLQMNGKQIKNMSEPTEANDAVTLSYFNANKGNGVSNLSQLNVDSNFNMKNLFKVTGLIEPTLTSDATTKNYVDNSLSNYYTKTYLDTALSGKLSSTANINSLSSQTADYSFNNYKLTNLKDPTNSQDATTKSYVDSKIPSIISSDIQTYTIESPAGSTNYTIIHTLNQTLQSLDIRVFYQIKTAVAGFIIGEYISSDYNDSDRSNNGQGGGVLFFDAGLQSSTQVLLRTNTTAAFYSTNRQTGGSILDIPWANVRIVLYMQVRSGTQILQANSMYTSQLLVNSGLNFTGYTIQANDPVNGSDLVTKSWVSANAQVGVSQKIQNGTVTTSSITCNSTEITLGTTLLNLNNQKLINLSNGTNSNDAVNLSQLQSYSPSQLISGLNSLVIDGTRLKLMNNLGTNFSISFLSNFTTDFYSNLFTISNTLQSQLFQITNGYTLSNQKMKISSSSITKNNPLYIDGSTVTGQTLLYLDNTNSATYAMQINNGDLQTNRDIYCRNIYPTSMNLSTLTATGTSNMQDINCRNLLATGEVGAEHFYITRAGTSLLDLIGGETIVPFANTIINSHTDQSGYYGFFSKNWISASNFQVYTPSSSKQFKKDIKEIDYSDLDQVQFKRFYYDEEQCKIRNIQADYTREYYNIIIEELPQSIKDRYCYQHENNIMTVDHTRLKDDIIQYHQHKIKDQQSRINYLESQLYQTNRKLDQLLQILNISV